MTQSGPPTMTRPIEEMLKEIHDRAAAIQRRKVRRRVLASVSGLAIVLAVVLAVDLSATPAAHNSATPAAHKTVSPSARHAAQLVLYQKVLEQTVAVSGGSTPQPPQQPVGSGWSAAKPSLPASVPSKWSPLVTSAFEVFEHETQNDQSATLSLVMAQGPSQVAMPQGTVEIDTLSGLVTDGQGGNWIMVATSQTPFSAGGSVIFRGDCTWTTAGTPQGGNGSANAQSLGTCTSVLVTLVGDPTNPYSAGVSKWRNQSATRAPMTTP
jgi:hypothetical protein